MGFFTNAKRWWRIEAEADNCARDEQLARYPDPTPGGFLERVERGVNEVLDAMSQRVNEQDKKIRALEHLLDKTTLSMSSLVSWIRIIKMKAACWDAHVAGCGAENARKTHKKAKAQRGRR